MGKGDRKTRRGKIWMGTFGVRRKRKRKKAIFFPASQSKPVKPEPVTRPLSPEVPSPKFSTKDEAPAPVEAVIPAIQPAKEAVVVEAPVIEQEIIEKAAAKKSAIGRISPPADKEAVIESPALPPEQAVDAEIKKEKVSGKRESAKPLKKAPAKKPAAAKKAVPSPKFSTKDEVAKTPASKKEKKPQKTVTPEEKKKRGRPAKGSR